MLHTAHAQELKSIINDVNVKYHVCVANKALLMSLCNAYVMLRVNLDEGSVQSKSVTT